MTRLGRHKSPLKEVSSQGGEAKPMAFTRARACLATVLSSFTLFATTQAALADDQESQASLAATPVVTTDILPSSQSSAPKPNFNLQMPPTSSTRMLDLNLDFDSIGCLVGEQNCLRDDGLVDVGFSKSLTKKSKKGLDVELVPTASMRFDDDGRSAAVGAVVRIGEDLRSKEVASNTWYVFAGADAEALSYSPESATALTRGEFGLSDRIIIGDAQAGVGYRIGSADVSLGYFRREVSTLNDSLGSDGFSKTEDAAALSFTWKR